jgi:transcription initiation factor TFIID subunit TAF12
MDDVMDNMTRAEYVLLAMRLPRDVSGDQAEETGPDTAKSDSHVQKQQTQEQQQQKQQQQQQKTQGVLWTTKASKPKVSQAPPSKVLGEEEQYQNFIATIS